MLRLRLSNRLVVPSGCSNKAFTLIEVLLGVLILLVAVAAIFAAYMGQITLSEHARNLSLAMNDANRIIEQIRQQNGNCAIPTSKPPGFNSWDGWLSDPANGKSMHLTADGPIVIMNTSADELVVVTCQSADASALCLNPTQIGTGEWNATAALGGAVQNPMRITVAICWRHRGRTIGECRWDAVNNAWDLASKAAWDNDTYPGNDTAGVIDSPAMASTLVTCHSSN